MKGSSPNKLKSSDRLTVSVTHPCPFAIMANGPGWVPSLMCLMVAVLDDPIMRRDDDIDIQWESRIRRVLETVPDKSADFLVMI